MKRARLLAWLPISFLALICCGEKEKPVEKKEIYTETRDIVSMVVEVNGKTEEVKNCPDDMQLVSGLYCAKTDEKCLYWVTIDNKRTNIETDRCGEFRKPVHCLVPRVEKSFCVDTFEWPNKAGVVPQNWMSFWDAKKACESVGKRLLTQSEWTMAAEGPDLHPYPFSDGFHRTRGVCNIDRHAHGIDVFKATSPNCPTSIALREFIVPSGSMPDCRSDFNIHEMSGNLDEWVVNESGRPHISGLMSGHWFGVRNKSTGITLAHGPTFNWYEVGTRCAKDMGKNIEK